MADTSIHELSIILAVTNSMGIGLNNKIPWKTQIPRENAYFHRISKRAPEGYINAVVMGRKSWNALSSPPLKDRLNIVITRYPAEVKQQALLKGTRGLDDVHFVASLNEALLRLSYEQNIWRTFIIGGGDLCRTALEHPCTVRFLMTLIDTDQTCDAFFPVKFTEVGYNGWRRCSVREHSDWAGEIIPKGRVAENGGSYEFMMFEKASQIVY